VVQQSVGDLENDAFVMGAAFLDPESRYTEIFDNWSIQIIRGYYRIVVTYIHINMAINVYEYGKGGKCLNMFTYTYAEIREMKMPMEKEDRHVSRFMRTSIGTVT